MSREARTSESAFSLPKARAIMQWSAVAAAFLIGLRHIMPGEASRGGSFDSFCPFGGIEILLPFVLRGETLKSTTLFNFSILIGVLGLTLMAGRAFCGWMCPLGTLQDYLARIARRLSGEKRHIRGKPGQAHFPVRLPQAVDHPLRYAKYFLLGGILIASLFTVHPPLFEFCPARAAFSLKLSPLLWGVLGIFIGGSLFVERIWCKYLCPFAAVMAPLNKISPLKVITESSRCNQCGRCDIECSMGLEDVPQNLDHPECVRCLECLETCARDGALFLAIGLRREAPAK